MFHEPFFPAHEFQARRERAWKKMEEESLGLERLTDFPSKLQVIAR